MLATGYRRKSDGATGTCGDSSVAKMKRIFHSSQNEGKASPFTPAAQLQSAFELERPSYVR